MNPELESERKRCTACGADKPLYAFHIDRSQSSGRRTRCADCENHARGNTQGRRYVVRGRYHYRAGDPALEPKPLPAWARGIRELIGADACDSGVTRLCSLCGRYLDTFMFQADPFRADGLSHRCASCVSAMKRRMTWEPRTHTCDVDGCESEPVLTYFCADHKSRATKPAQKAYRRAMWRQRFGGAA